MLKSNQNWLREDTWDHIANSDGADKENNILNFCHSPRSAKSPGASALELVYQAAELIEHVESHAAERHACAETLAKQAIERLNMAHERVCSAETARSAAEGQLKEFSTQVEQKLAARIDDIEKAVDQMAAQMAATEAQLAVAEQRALGAELRASEAENALERIEEALRTQILAKAGINPNRVAAAA